MNDRASPQDPVKAIALLGEPNRRRVYDYVAGQPDAVGRDETAAALGISRELAAFHLDRLLAGDMLETEYRRRSGRTGPGAGRPAKLYRRTQREVAVSIPERRYEIAADVFAEGLRQLGTPGADAVAGVARGRGREMGLEARRTAGPRPTLGRLVTALLGLLSTAGYEPEVHPSSGAVSLRNCPYRSLATSHRDLTCGMNLAWAEGVADGLSAAEVAVALTPAAGRCCVTFQPAANGPRRGAGGGDPSIGKR